MQPKRLLSLLMCLFLLAPAVLAAPDDTEVDRMFRNAKTVGGSVVVYSRWQLVYARDYGVKNVRQEPVDADTFFRTASITKMVTGVGLMTLVEQGKLDLDQDISAYFGYEIGNSRFGRVPITLRQLMSHTSSLRDTGGYSKLNNTVESLLKKSLKRTANFENYAPGSQYKYSNFGAGVTGAMMEAVSGQSIHSYMNAAVFSPLGIQGAYSASLVPDPGDVSSQFKDGKVSKSGSLSIKDGYEDHADPEDHYRITIGDLWMRSRDLARLLALLAGGGELDGVRLLSVDSLQQMMAQQDALQASVTGESPYGLFLEHNDTLVKGKMLYGHQGMSSGAILNAYFEPHSQFVIVVFSNGGSMVRFNRVSKLARAMVGYFWPMYGE